MIATLTFFWSCSNDNENEVFTITFETDGGTPIPTVQRVEKGGTASVPSPNPAKPGYVFICWHLNGVTSAYDFQAPINNNTVLYARWEEETKTEYWQINWNLNGGSWPAEDNHATRVPKGGTITEPAEPTKTGCTFNGWYTEPKLTNGIAFPYDTSNLTTDITLYAGWTTNENENPGMQYGIETVKIVAGTFLMGGTEGEIYAETPAPVHRVKLTQDFYMSKYEITNAQLATFLNANGDRPILGGESSGSDHDWGLHREGSKWIPRAGYENHPAIFVDWYTATAYAEWVGGSLPTEAQWEYACRAGTTTPWSTASGTVADLGEYAWYTGNSNGTTHEVGTKKPNPWGLYDMHGNVYEWCNDFYDANYGLTKDELAGTVIDPVGPDKGFNRMLRGGSWYRNDRCTSAIRFYAGYFYASSSQIGFRVVFPCPK